jgi:hypothetical protein
VSKESMNRRTWNVSAVAFVMIATGIGLPIAYKAWFNTRTFQALDSPVSLSKHHFRAPDFNVNIKGWYQIFANLNYEASYDSGCGFVGTNSVLKTHTVIHGPGKSTIESESADHFLGHFYADKKGIYSVDIEVQSDASCLNVGDPRISIWTAADSYMLYYHDLEQVAAVLIAVGVGVLVFSLAGNTSEDINHIH